MNKTWMQWVAAAIVIILAGVLIAAAEERIEVRVEKENDDRITVDVNGVSETIELDDLTDGESRSFDVGGHELVVKRVGDALTVISDGHAFGDHGDAMHQMVWVTDDGKTIEIDRDCAGAGDKMIVMKIDADDHDGDAQRSYVIKLDGDELSHDGEHEIDIEEIIAAHGHGGHGAIFITDDGDVQPLIGVHDVHGDMVTYRCEETGATLMLKKEDAVEDSYVCPATGCVMTKVETPAARVIKIKKRVEVEEEK